MADILSKTNRSIPELNYNVFQATGRALGGIFNPL